MGKKRDLANEHIEILVEELVDTRREALGSGNCPHYRKCPPNHGECHDCKWQYFEDMKRSLLKKYIVK